MIVKTSQGGNRPISDISKGNHYPGSNTAAIVTIAAIASRRHVLHKLIWSYSADPTGGRLTITDGGTTVFDISITKGGPGSLNLSTPFGINSAVVITLAAGGASVTGKVNVEYTTD